jgi:hypothetical protein
LTEANFCRLRSRGIGRPIQDPQHRLRQSYGKLEHCDFGEHLIGVPQSLTQEFDEARPGGWVSLEERENVTPFENRHSACSLRNGICGSLFAIQNRKLAEYFAGLNHGQHQLFASRGRHADANGPAEQSHHLVAAGADGEDGFARGKRPDTGESNDRTPLVGTQALEQSAIR